MNQDGRVLLFSGRLVFSGRLGTGRPATTWFTPGGAVHPGETLAAAAARELAEETGHVLSEDRLGPVVAVCSGEWAAGDTVFLGTDWFFFVCAAAIAVDTSGQETLERSVITGHRWWAADELERTDELVLPHGLAALLRRLLAGDIPAAPVRLPWRLPGQQTG